VLSSERCTHSVDELSGTGGETLIIHSPCYLSGTGRNRDSPFKEKELNLVVFWIIAVVWPVFEYYVHNITVCHDTSMSNTIPVQ